jgi:hypothetical protein
MAPRRASLDLFTKRLGQDSVWAAWASVFSNARAPNEFGLADDFFKGIECVRAIVKNLTQV